MNDQRRQQLRTRYLGLEADYARRFESYDCGRELAEYLDPELTTVGRAMREIEEEVQAAIAEEQAS